MRRKRMLTILGIALVLIICFLAGLYILGIRSEPYKHALEFIEDHELITETLGPLRSRRLALFGYTVRERGVHGHAEYKVLVKGEKAKGAVYLEMEKSAGIWKVVAANLVPDKGNPIPLVDGHG